MAVSLASVRRKSDAQLRPPIMALYGTAGIGKTTFAANAPSPIFVQTEDGLGQLDAATFGVLTTFDDVLDALKELAEQPHDYQTVVFDSLDWAEPLVAAQTCAENNWENLEQAGFGKGYIAAQEVWRRILGTLKLLRDDRGMGVIMIAHPLVTKFEDPAGDGYSRYGLKLHQRWAPLVIEIADIVGFANYVVGTTKSDAGFGKKIARGVGAGHRTLYLQERPAFVAKNRYNLPDSIEFDWNKLAAGIPFYKQGTNNNG